MYRFSNALVLISVLAVAGAIIYFNGIETGPEVKGATPDSISKPEPEPVSTGNQAPDFTFTSMDGEVVTLSEYKGDKPVLLNFWGTFCQPCMEELPVLERFYEANKYQMEIIAVSSEPEDSETAVNSARDRLGLTFPVLHDTAGRIESLYPHAQIPYNVLIDRNGEIISRITGYDPGIEWILKVSFDLE
ncbi:MAG TPA: TlpA family protein disulfide reductase [bacterium]|jgi:peroxiredoxin